MAISREWIPCPLCKSKEHEKIMSSPVMMQNLAGSFHFVKCTNCSLVFLNPRVPLAEVGLYYPENYFPYRGEKAWGKYAPLASIGLKGMDQKRVNIVRKVYPISSDTKVLDIGCGKPTFLKALHKKTHCQAYGIDFNDRGWKDATGFDQLHLTSQMVEELAEDSSFDVMTMWHYLEHDYSPKDTLQKLLKVAQPHTRLVIEVPNYASWTRKKQGNYWGGFHTPRHTVLYTPDTLSKMLHQNGWQTVQVKTYGTMDPFIVWWLGEMERKKINWEASMEKRFLKLLFQKIVTAPFFALERFLSFGILLVVARPKEK